MMKEPPIPEKLDVQVTTRGITMCRRWLGWHILPVAIFAVVWNSVLFAVYRAILGSDEFHWFPALFPLGHLCVGVALGYYVIAALFNRTCLTISPGRLRVKTAPVFWGRERTVDVLEITDTRVKFHGDEGNRPSFGILYTNRENKEKVLVRSGFTDDQAFYINFHLRKALGLPDDRDEGQWAWARSRAVSA